MRTWKLSLGIILDLLVNVQHILDSLFLETLLLYKKSFVIFSFTSCPVLYYLCEIQKINSLIWGVPETSRFKNNPKLNNLCGVACFYDKGWLTLTAFKNSCEFYSQTFSQPFLEVVKIYRVGVIIFKGPCRIKLE